MLQNKKITIELFILFILFFAIGVFYSGDNFLNNFSTSLPTNPVGDALTYMTPGDHFEQFYRYSLLKHNVLNGESIIFSGYQYNYSVNNEFTEGLVFFPFSFINAFFSMFIGNIASYNLMALLSYVFSGFSMYYLIKYLSRDYYIAITVAVFYVTVPFHTSFLYGEMLFALDAALLPLLILFYQKFYDTGKKINILYFSIISFFLFTSNLQVAYFIFLFTFPYFVFKYLYYILYNPEDKIKYKLQILLYFIVGILPSISYTFYIIKNVMSSSGLSNGQVWNELFIYSPNIQNMFSVFNGNEKNVYLGYISLFVLVVIIIYGYKNILKYFKKDMNYGLFIFSFLFILTYILSFGPNFDSAFNIEFYKLLFNYLPMFNGTRTPGRLMSINVLYFGIILSYILVFLFAQKKIHKWKTIITISLLTLILTDYKYLKPSMVKIENNTVYSELPEKTKILAVPFRIEPDHYENATYMYFAIKNNLRFFNGHSSFFPKEMAKASYKYKELNDGKLSKDTWQWLKNNNFEYLSVHNTKFQPNVQSSVLLLLMLNKNLTLLNNSNGIYIFKIGSERYIESDISFYDIYKLSKTMNFEKDLQNKIIYSLGWYNLEKYPNQKSFRWMEGKLSVVNYIPVNNKTLKLSFYYKNPSKELSLIINEEKTNFSYILKDGWKFVELELTKKDYYEIKFITEDIYTVQTDSRTFGCMISNINIKESE